MAHKTILKMNTGSKNIILQRIKNGLKTARFKRDFQETGNKDLIFNKIDKPLLEIFKEELIKINGEYFYFSNEEELINHLTDCFDGLAPIYCSDSHLIKYLETANIEYYTDFDHKEIKTGFSSCEYLIARFGSVMVSSALPGARKVFSYPHTHIVIAKENQLVAELEDALAGMKQKYGSKLPSQIINITGPSRTADIEKTLILGAHGPKRFMVFILKS
ncbi:MAG: lactate utilization protein [Bacteroidales bacterium]|nr:lactate utilization protein [Bacteroidales bacterium]